MQRRFLPGRAIPTAYLGLLLFVASSCATQQVGSDPSISFVDATNESGLSHSFAVYGTPDDEMISMMGGIAVADVDSDGDPDLLVVGGNQSEVSFFLNDGSGAFEGAPASWGFGLDAQTRSGPVFVDIDGDADLDFFAAGMSGAATLLRNDGNSFSDISRSSGIEFAATVTSSSSFFDFDGDGDLDLFATHWGHPHAQGSESLWMNDGQGGFVDVDKASNVDQAIQSAGISRNYSFSATWTDIDRDGDPDGLVTSDFGTSFVLRNIGDGKFQGERDEHEFSECCAMGSSVADFDGDGDMDWFVTSIYPVGEDEPDQKFGNRLYSNDGDGTFSDETPRSLLDGGWGWGACAADFDNDGWVDLYHVGGWSFGHQKVAGASTNDSGRLFMNMGAMSFQEVSSEVGARNDAEGRAVACFDAENDGDIDIAITNAGASGIRLLRNESTVGTYLKLRLRDQLPNRYAVGARAEVTRGGELIGVREVRIGGGFLAQEPSDLHFGLGASDEPVTVRIQWSDGEDSTYDSVLPNQLLEIERDYEGSS